jgi:hypothetical protein
MRRRQRSEASRRPEGQAAGILIEILSSRLRKLGYLKVACCRAPLSMFAALVAQYFP